MDRRWYLTALSDDDLRCRREWTLAVAVLYVTVLGVLGDRVAEDESVRHGYGANGDGGPHHSAVCRRSFAPIIVARDEVRRLPWRGSSG